MQLVLKNTGSNTKFVNWLKGFKDIVNILLIEVDIPQQKFIAKSFPESRSIVKYDELSFADAGYEIESLSDNEGKSLLTAKKTLVAAYKDKMTGDDRIKVGLYNILNKFIDVETMYASGVEHTMTIHFDVSNNVKYARADEACTQWQSEKVILQSKSLAMTVKCSTLTEFFVFLKDDTFVNNVAVLEDPVSFTVTPEAIVNLNRISLLFASDKTRSTIKLYTKQDSDGKWGLYAFDATNKSYDYLMCYLEGGVSCIETEAFVLREFFITAAKSIDTEMQISMSTVAGSARIIISTADSKTVVSTQQSH